MATTESPWLAFGTGTALYNSDATAQVLAALNAGITHIDTAQMYRNEETVGDALAQYFTSTSTPRDKIFVTTKLVPSKDRSAREKELSVKELLQESLKKLKLDYVDLFLIHSPHLVNKTAEGLKAQWKELEGVLEDGLAKRIGVSNFRVEDLEVVLSDAKVVPWVNQIELHPHIYASTIPTIQLCKSKGIRIAAYAGLSPVIDRRFPGTPLVPVLESIAAKIAPGATPGQILTRWSLQKGVDIVVTTSSKSERLTEALKSKDVPELSEQDIRTIDEEGAKHEKRKFMAHIWE